VGDNRFIIMVLAQYAVSLLAVSHHCCWETCGRGTNVAVPVGPMYQNDNACCNGARPVADGRGGFRC
jgi:hypothetical protein